MMLLSPEPWC